MQELIKETIAEEVRSNQWDRVFPCLQNSCRYLDQFAMVRADTSAVCHALRETSCAGWLNAPEKLNAEQGKAWR